jgi:hypothetical protein
MNLVDERIDQDLRVICAWPQYSDPLFQRLSESSLEVPAIARDRLALNPESRYESTMHSIPWRGAPSYHASPVVDGVFMGLAGRPRYRMRTSSPGKQPFVKRRRNLKAEIGHSLPFTSARAVAEKERGPTIAQEDEPVGLDGEATARVSDLVRTTKNIRTLTRRRCRMLISCAVSRASPCWIAG